MTVRIDRLVIGERFKGGLFRPCQVMIPSSSIEGAFSHKYGCSIHAFGTLVRETYCIKETIYSVQDRFLNMVKIPLTTSYLEAIDSRKKIAGIIYVVEIDGVYKQLIQQINTKGTIFHLGALKSKGFGRCEIINIKQNCSFYTKQGWFNTKVFADECPVFGITPITPVYGYLFRPDQYHISGTHQKALFPGSLVRAPEIFLRGSEKTYYDE